MAETYCGKNCTVCSLNEAKDCPGCRVGPGRRLDGDCEIARCCRNSGHETCETCTSSGHCGLLRGKSNMPEYRSRRNQLEEEKAEAVSESAHFLGKWLWILFWMIVPNTVSAIMTNDATSQLLPGLYLPGQILGIVCTCVYGGILLKLSSNEVQYRTAGICSIATSVVNLILTLVFPDSASAWVLLISLPAAIIALVGEYNEFSAHSSVISNLDTDLSQKWTTLWKWYIGSFAVSIASIVFALIIPVLGALAALVSSFGLLIISILKIVYLYRTAQTFRAY